MTDGASLQGSESEAWWVGALTAAVVATMYFCTGVFDHDVWSPRERTVSGVVWNMFRHGSFAVPRIDEFPYLEKSPLSYWLSWLTCQANGKLTAACLRLPSTIFGVMSLGLLYWVARRRNNAVVACVTVLFAATSIVFYQLSHRAGPDILVIFFVFLCFALFSLTLLQNGGRQLDPFAYDMGFAAAPGGVFLRKELLYFSHCAPARFTFSVLQARIRPHVPNRRFGGDLYCSRSLAVGAGPPPRGRMRISESGISRQHLGSVF
jgi:hypothetical protein